MSEYAAGFRPRGWSSSSDDKLDAPAFHRNHEQIWAVLSRFLQAPSTDVLEVASGTGQHALAFARHAPSIVWWPSDYAETHLRSIAAWRADAQLPNLRAPVRLDLAVADWWSGAAGGDRPRAYGVMFCANVLHISPWSVSQGLFAGAAHLLTPDGRLLIYGPFMRDHAHTAPSNAAFDLSLRQQNAAWGVRDIGDLVTVARAPGLTLVDIHDMPANNFILVFARSEAVREMKSSHSDS
jgi:SAM-dependent methyltransferase